MLILFYKVFFKPHFIPGLVKNMYFFLYLYIFLIGASASHVYISPNDRYKYTMAPYSHHLRYEMHNLPDSFEEALSKNDFEKIRIFLDAGFNPNTPLSSGKIALFYPISLGSYKMCKKLLYYKYEPNTQDSDGCTALHFAISFGQIEIMKLLLNYGSDPSVKDSNGLSCTELSNQNGNKKIINALETWDKNNGSSLCVIS